MVLRSRTWILFAVALSALTLTTAACGGDDGGGEDADGKNDPIVPGGKADDIYSDCQIAQVLAHVNTPSVTDEVLRADGVHSRAAGNIYAYRNGFDGIPRTGDDDFFDDIQELDDVYFVGPKAMEQLVAATGHRCDYDPMADVIFSPQSYESSHLTRAAELIDAAEQTIDVAMYSFREYNILDALEAAVGRGVQVRFIFESANNDRREPEGTFSARLEDIGINVRYVNKIMHHKFAIIDGPAYSLDGAYEGTLITGSGNWSNSAGTRYDENTVIVTGSGELLLRFQKEFNHLWANSRDFVWDESLELYETMEITDRMIVDDPMVDAVYTSANFRTRLTHYGPTFTVITGSNEVADALVDLIGNASQSIHVASGHLRSRPVADALMAKAAANPGMDIRVLLDNQEYISLWYHQQQYARLVDCLNESGGDLKKQQECYDRGYYYSYPVHEAGIPLKFKYYCYRWHYSYAVQMHHKYMVVDGEIVASGSYNLSDNAEHNTMENMVVYDGRRFAGLVSDFEQNFEELWVEGEADNLYTDLLDLIENTRDPFPIVFEPMALTWDQVTQLKEAIRTNCPDVSSDEYRNHPEDHRWCNR